jgi:hypothetical protein
MAVWPELSLPEKDIAAAIGQHINGHEGEAFPGYEALKAETGLRSSASVAKGIAGLKRRGLLEVRRRRNSSNRYFWTSAATDIPPSRNIRAGEPRTSAPADIGTSAPADIHITKTPTLNSPTKTSQEEGGASAPPAAEAAPAPVDSVETILDAWNALPEVFPRARLVTKARRAKARARLSEPAWRRDWCEALSRLPGSAFLRGENDRAWKADLDWFLKAESVNRILEGKYDGGRKASGRAFASAGSDPDKFKRAGKE